SNITINPYIVLGNIKQFNNHSHVPQSIFDNTTALLNTSFTFFPPEYDPHIPIQASRVITMSAVTQTIDEADIPYYEIMKANYPGGEQIQLFSIDYGSNLKADKKHKYDGVSFIRSDLSDIDKSENDKTDGIMYIGAGIDLTKQDEDENYYDEDTSSENELNYSDMDQYDESNEYNNNENDVDNTEITNETTTFTNHSLKPTESNNNSDNELKDNLFYVGLDNDDDDNEDTVYNFMKFDTYKLENKETDNGNLIYLTQIDQNIEIGSEDEDYFSDQKSKSNKKYKRHRQHMNKRKDKHFTAHILPGNKINLRSVCRSGDNCQESATRSWLRVSRGYLLALAETSPTCVLWLVCQAAAEAAHEGVVGALAATIASGLASQFPSLVAGARTRDLVTARNIGLKRPKDCTAFKRNHCRLIEEDYG
ncbi:unnamed protein product, partial [Meganyctiphanes norvegica]